MESKEEDLQGRELLVQEFSWDDQGFCVMSNFYSDIAVLLDDKFRLAHSLVDTMEENKEQETIFRRAVWNYVQVQHFLSFFFWQGNLLLLNMQVFCPLVLYPILCKAEL